MIHPLPAISGQPDCQPGSAIDRHMPTEVIRPRHPPCPWLTDNDELRALMREHGLAHGAKLERPSPETQEEYRASEVV